jgi:predicted transcriptional regulator
MRGGDYEMSEQAQVTTVEINKDTHAALVEHCKATGLKRKWIADAAIRGYLATEAKKFASSGACMHATGQQ